MDVESGFPIDITLKYLPPEADKDNIIITSSNEKVIKVVRETAADKLNQFKIYPVNIGSDEYISISTTNLDSVYKIYVNVYRPIKIKKETTYIKKMAPRVESHLDLL